MKRKKKLGCALIAIIVAIVLISGLYWTWKYYGLPEWSAYRGYKPVEERAERALDFAKQHNLNEHYALFVDYSIPSGTPRLFVWDFQKKKDCGQYLCNAWSRWWEYRQTPAIQ